MSGSIQKTITFLKDKAASYFVALIQSVFKSVKFLSFFLILLLFFKSQLVQAGLFDLKFIPILQVEDVLIFHNVNKTSNTSSQPQEPNETPTQPQKQLEVQTSKDYKLELGLAAGYGLVPQYPGSNQYDAKELYLPYFVYRGDVLKADQERGTRAEFFKTEFVELSLSFGFRFATRSENSQARMNMPDLNYLLETGPSLNYTLFREAQVQNLVLQIPLRFSIETNFKKWTSRGVVFEPELRYQRFNFLIPQLRSTTSIAVEFMSQEIADYYYGVAPEYSQVTRPTYQAQAGFSAYSLSQNFIYTYNDITFIAGASKTFFNGTKNVSSPLMKSLDNSSVFLALAWTLYKK